MYKLFYRCEIIYLGCTILRKKEYLKYTNWKESIGGYKRGVQYKYFKKEYKDYYQFLDDIKYASDPQYTIKLRKLVKKLKR